MKKVGTDIWFDKLLKKFRGVESTGNLSGVSVFNRPGPTFSATLISILSANANRIKKYLSHVSEVDLLLPDVFIITYNKCRFAVTSSAESHSALAIAAYLQKTAKELPVASFSGINIFSIKNQHML